MTRKFLRRPHLPRRATDSQIERTVLSVCSATPICLEKIRERLRSHGIYCSSGRLLRVLDRLERRQKLTHEEDVTGIPRCGYVLGPNHGLELRLEPGLRVMTQAKVA